MLAITAPERCYVNDLLEGLKYEKIYDSKGMSLYKTKYNNHEFIIITNGYGKINIASSLRYLIDNYKINVIINVGTVGSTCDTNTVFSAIIPNNCLEFDVDFTPLGYSEALIPLMDKGIYNTNNDLTECLNKASQMCGINYVNNLIATGDMFVCNNSLTNSIRREYNVGGVDCECATTGHFCYVNDIPFACIKVVSNLSGTNAAKQYNLYDAESSKTAQRIVHKFLKLYYE